MSDKIAPEAAKAEIEGIEKHFGAKLKEEDRALLERMVAEGRISFDSGKETFAYRLRVPVECKSITVTDITLKEPTGGQLRDMGKAGRTDLDASLALLTYITGQTLVVVEALKQRDLLVLTALLGFFG